MLCACTIYGLGYLFLFSSPPVDVERTWMCDDDGSLCNARSNNTIPALCADETFFFFVPSTWIYLQHGKFVFLCLFCRRGWWSDLIYYIMQRENRCLILSQILRRRPFFFYFLFLRRSLIWFAFIYACCVRPWKGAALWSPGNGLYSVHIFVLLFLNTKKNRRVAILRIHIAAAEDIVIRSRKADTTAERVSLVSSIFFFHLVPTRRIYKGLDILSLVHNIWDIINPDIIIYWWRTRRTVHRSQQKLL